MMLNRIFTQILLVIIVHEEMAIFIITPSFYDIVKIYRQIIDLKTYA